MTNFFPSFIFFPTAKDPGHIVKMRQNLLILFLRPFILYLSRFHLFDLSNFLKIPLIDSLDILRVGAPRKNYIT